jgi:hypothetical protein
MKQHGVARRQLRRRASIIRRTSNRCLLSARSGLDAPLVYDRRVAEQTSIPVFLAAILYWCMGLLVGAALGAVTSVLLTKNLRWRGIFKDGLAGSIGFLAGIAGVSLIPTPPHTVMYISNGNVETTTTFRYQHPLPVAFVVAALLPILRELYLFWRSRRMCPAGDGSHPTKTTAV